MLPEFFLHIKLHVVCNFKGKTDVVRREADCRERNFIHDDIPRNVRFRFAGARPIVVAPAVFFDGSRAVFAGVAVDDVVKARKRVARIVMSSSVST